MNEESRPAKAAIPTTPTASIAGNVDNWDRLAAQVNGAFVVLVETSHGRYRRRVWLTVAPAERAVQKAHDAGHNAVVILAELKPLYRVKGAAPDQPMLGRTYGGVSDE